ncbi:undecaprenyldiphospho-muramoylpentapeptide beta-N-acetylglucosaminyltransferase [Lactovum miscens]|uniref:UDP-N-acetylglucosamine--N-acetylmuramyl-(pentapeptide) pyrophosphoryl-undecaprenol N-acetylglucosamine transferase n=1 Tax=Lactovum miscens TaxID=190387 RepID=A0A841C749_9LACT|nr:undecaprenyldiphospho-muramoylpentapeptide beta-N-acetylglucosaminyltransferase [Lactovum miscens]MBB5887219.1 UDP-N-acetylglucosamine--N-acetylmuramyl-(pentapeptide) pyrophosphoryl-undecaprenol N-acetylglucosamine transferase [Lactovum miscens]
MRIILTGGGTGGHIYPALAFAKYLKTVDNNAEILYIGTDKGLESKIVPAAGYDFKTIDIQGIRRSLSLQNLVTAWKYIRSTLVAKKIIQDFKPDIVMGTGGYVCAPVVNAAIKLGIPTILHEQNAVPGVANKHLASGVTKIVVAFHHAEKYFPKNKVVFAGNPRAQEVADIQPSDIIKNFGLDPNKRTVVIFGGSRGALTINEALVKALPKLAEQKYQILYASGEIYYDNYKEEFEKYSDKGNIVIRPYLSNMSELLSSIDLIVARSGATTIAEVTALGLPSIFIPSPNVTNDQQTKNAMELVEAGAAVIIKDSELTAELLIQSISDILEDTVKYSEMQEASRKSGVPDASERLYKIIKEIVN